MKEFGLQLWSIGQEFTSAEKTLNAFKWMQKCGYTQAQTAGTYDYMPAEDFKAYADECGISIVGTHYNWDRLREDVEGTVKYHNILGTKEIGVGGGWGNDSLESTANFIKMFNDLAKIYHSYGFVLSYHNHSWEFSNEMKKYEGKRFFDYLIEGLDPETTRFNLDVAWAHLAGMDVRDLMERLKGRINIIHLKDVQAEYHYGFIDKNGYEFTGPNRIEIGSGNMNFPGIIKTGEETGVKYFVVEDEVYSTGNAMESIKISADYIKSHLLEK